MVNKAISDDPGIDEDEEVVEVKTMKKGKAAKPTLTKSEQKNMAIAKKKREAGAQVRIKVSCMNPNKRDWVGEIFSSGNRFIGNFKKFVPFDNDEGWHVPQILVTMIQNRQTQIFVEKKDRLGNKVKQGKMVKEFSVEILPPLNKAQLQHLADQQALNHSIET